jgi:hypothetical protein
LATAPSNSPLEDADTFAAGPNATAKLPAVLLHCALLPTPLIDAHVAFAVARGFHSKGKVVVRRTVTA